MTLVLPALSMMACTAELDPGVAPDRSTETEALGTDAYTVRLLPEEQHNLLLPYGVALDDERRRVYAASISFRAVVAVDLDSAEIVGSYDLGADVTMLSPNLAVDGEGVVWVVNGGTPGLLRIDPAMGTVDQPDSGLDFAYIATALPAGGAVVYGAVRGADGFSERLVVLDPEGTRIVASEPEAPILGLAAGDGGDLGLLVQDGEGHALELRDPADLALLESCAAPSTAQVLEPWGDGTWITGTQTTLARFSCDDGTLAESTIDGQNNAMVVVPEGVLVLDRQGDTADTAGQKDSWVRPYSPELESLGYWHAGHSTSKGAWDTTGSRLWVNSEDSSELVAIDATGETVARVLLGRHVEDVLSDPDDPGRVWFTGRLTDTVGWLDLRTGEVTFRDGLAVWPVSPVLAEGRLWAVGHTDGVVVGLDPDTLEEEVRIETGRTNNLHTFDDLAWDASRGVLWLAQSESNELVGIAPDTGEETVVALPGDPIDNSGLPAQLQVVVGDGGAVWTCRSADGLVARVEADTVVASATLSEAQVEHDRELRRADACHLSRDGGTLWFWGLAFDAGTLDRKESKDVDATQVIGQLDGGRLVWEGEAREVRLLSTTGEVREALAIDGDGEQPMFAWDEEEARLVYTDVFDGRVTSVSLAGWED